RRSSDLAAEAGAVSSLELKAARSLLVRTTGIEPVRVTPRDFKSLASTSSATSARRLLQALVARSQCLFCQWTGASANAPSLSPRLPAGVRGEARASP